MCVCAMADDHSAVIVHNNLFLFGQQVGIIIICLVIVLNCIFAFCICAYEYVVNNKEEMITIHKNNVRIDINILYNKTHRMS